MQKLSPQSLFTLFFFFFATPLFSQGNLANTPSNVEVVAQEMIGVLNCTYSKITSANGQNDFALQIVFKNQKYIYKQESDTINITNKVNLALLIKDLKAGVAVIDEDQKSITWNSGFYIFSKDNINMDNKMLTFWNKDQNISASINKYFAKQLIEWLEALPFENG